MFALHCLSENNHLVCITGVCNCSTASKMSPAQELKLPTMSSFYNTLTHHSGQVHTAEGNTNNSQLQDVSPIQWRPGNIKSIHLFNCIGQGQQGNIVAECRAGFAMLAACFHLGQEGSCALHRTGRVPAAHSQCRVDVSNGSSKCWVFALPGDAPCSK